MRSMHRLGNGGRASRRAFGSVSLAVGLGLGVAVGCGDSGKLEDAAEKVEETARELEENVGNAAETMEDTYAEKRAEGEGRVEAAGDAYNEVLEVPEEEKKSQ